MKVNSPKIRISNQVSFPLDYIKGTEEQRFAYSRRLTEDLFQKVYDLFPTKETNLWVTKTISVSKKIIEKKIQEILPKSLNIKISNLIDTNKHTHDESGSCYFVWTEKNGIYNIDEKGIWMPLAENKKICADNMYILLHEFTHIMDYTINPKICLREAKISFNKTFPSDLFFKYINTDNKKFNFINKAMFNTELERYMRDLSDEQKVDILQMMRYAIKSEINAYSNGLNYQTEIDRHCGIDRNLKSDKQRLSEHDFDRKLIFINKKLSRTLSKTRKKQYLKRLDSSALRASE